MPNSFNIGDEVYPKIIGFPGKGTVIGIIDAQLAPIIFPNASFSLFDNLYPTWTTSICYFVFFDEARKRHSLSDIKIAYPQMSDDKARRYFEDYEKTHIILYPQEDLGNPDE